MENIRKNKVAVICSTISLIIIGVLYLQNQHLKWEMIYQKSVPDVELINYLTFDSNNVASGGVVGFVVFDDKEKQPREMRQYIQIMASSDFIGGRQVFYLTDIIKMDVLSPRYLDPVVLTTSKVERNIVTLTDGNNNSYIIDKGTKELSMFDSTRDVSRLITKDSEFREFMRDFLAH